MKHQSSSPAVIYYTPGFCTSPPLDWGGWNQPILSTLERLPLDHDKNKTYAACLEMGMGLGAP